jgi:hypothetical protein
LGESGWRERPPLNPVGEEFPTVDPRPGTVASDGVVRNNTKDMPTGRMRNASVTNVFFEVRLDGNPKFRPTVLKIVPLFGVSEPPPIKRISSSTVHS